MKQTNKIVKPTFSISAALSLVVMAIAPLHVGAFAGGSGTSGSPYQIASCVDLLSISNLAAYYSLNNDIDCSANGNNVITGSSSTPFTGNFNGNWHTITVNINVTGTTNTGLFGYVQNGTISKLRVAGSVVSDSDNTGMVAGYFDASSAEYVTAAGTVSSTANYVGGMFGRTVCSSTISSSTVTANVTGSTYTGGLSGRDIGGSAGFGDCGGSGYGSTVTDTGVTGNVTGYDNTGGLFGISYDSDITRAHTSGYVHGHDQVGGLIGYNNRFSGTRKIFASSATGAVTGRYSLGGLVGEMPNGEISQSYASGSVTATGGDDMGGLVGRAVLGSNITIRNSYARGAVNTGGGADSGSVVGYGTSTTHIINSYGTGLITTSVCGGGLNGCGVLAEATNSFWDTQTTGKGTACGSGSCGGTGKTTTQMKTASTFTGAGWDFTDIWGMDSAANNGYPYLIAQVSYICEAPQVTATTGRVACDTSYEDTSIDSSALTWQARYRKASDNSWTTVTIDDSSQGVMLFRNLTPNTDYYLSVKPTGAGYATWAQNDITTLSTTSDVDSDGVYDVTENAGPNNGDVNQDGILDARETDIATLSNSVSGNYTTLTTDCTAVGSVMVTPESSDHQDAGYDYTSGLLSFTATGCGTTATFTQYFFGNYDPATLLARKYNSTTHAYTTIPGAVLSKVTINGQNALKITYQITDNSSLDQSPVTGTITDPSGPATQVVGVPNTGLELVH